MPVLVQFTFRTPVFDTAARNAPGSALRLDGHYVLETGDIGWRVWIESADFEAFESGLDADGTVASHGLLGEEGSRRLYKVRLSDAGRRASLLPVLGECGGEFVGGEITEDAWSVHLRFPNSAAFQAFSGVFESRDGGSLTVESIHHEASCDSSEFELTPSQREALRVALDDGYFDIPRGTTLVALAAELGVSDQAVSERLRRAQKRVFERVLVADEGGSADEG